MAPAEVERISVTVDDADWVGRADKYLTERLGVLSRSQLQKRCHDLRINGVAAKPSHRVRCGDTIEILLEPEPQSVITAEAIELSVIFENDDVVVVNKPRGMVVHPGAGNWTGTLAQGLMYHVAALSDQADDSRPGIVHRLDKDTSGVLICAKHTAAKELLSAQFAERRVQKHYLALVKGIPRPVKGSVAGSIARDPANRKRFRWQPEGGKEAETRYRLLRSYRTHSLVLLEPRTGRTHQLRVHMSHLGTPVLGDSIYGRRDRLFPDAGLCLHALALSIMLPGEQQPRVFTAAIPVDMLSIIASLRMVQAGSPGSMHVPLQR